MELARNERGDLLLARLAPAVWGVQGHPEADLTIVTGWAVKESGTPDVAGIDLPAVLGAVSDAQPRVDATWRPVAEAFARLL